MAGTPRDVLAFLDDLAMRARPYAERDMTELRDFARAELGLAEVRACDVAYVSEKRFFGFEDGVGLSCSGRFSRLAFCFGLCLVCHYDGKHHSACHRRRAREPGWPHDCT